MTEDPRGQGDGGESVREVVSILRRGWLTVVAVGVLVGLLALGYSLIQTPEYQATATLYVTSGADDNSQTAYQGSLASQQRVTSYTKLVDSDAVLQQAISDGGLKLSVSDAKSKLAATTTTDTVLLNIIATDSSRATASNLANAVAQSMTSYVARLETPSGGGRPLAKLTVVTPASAGDKAVTPKTTRNVALGVVVGLLIGLLGVLARARFSNKVESESDFGAISDTPVLGAIPADDLLKKKGLIDFKGGATPAAEAFRKVRTNLTFASVDRPPKIILVSSPIAVEGKTTTAMNLAAALVEAGRRVVLVDADLRRPQVDQRSGLLGHIGFTNSLRGDGELADLVQPSTVEGLWVLASGPQPPNPAELLGSKRAGTALTELAASFDYVIVDSAPVLPVTDAAVLAQWVDGVLIVARAGATKIGDLTDAYEQLSGSGTPIIGFVLTETTATKGRYGYYAVNPTKKKSFFGRNRAPKAIEDVLEPRRDDDR
ncbi:polysaccharide biosynthesis tyrosine autokinase [Williamsia sp.]|uniref:polysaccharide biosynthesis tyrosine autokinase n=1 Tax=Williamsia sp. TaxID=1872085 RepID=UPI001A3354B1|nr:polysaccharide biosynthesis tyrosine autokinase [Williamsia sp.]MBJ7289739.1 polysaccharide biosynthesis tyrosine autokinase [Williamsia sp.]